MNLFCLCFPPLPLVVTRSHMLVPYLQLSTSIYVKNGKICIFLNVYYMIFEIYVLPLPSEIVPNNFFNTLQLWKKYLNI